MQNESYDPALIQFEAGYEVTLNHSPTFQKFQDNVIDRLITKFDLRGKKVLEIGCGNGLFLKELCRRGDNRGVGIDPAAPATTFSDSRVELVADYFTERYSDIECDFICASSVFEDIPDVAKFLHATHRLSLTNNAPVYFEVFNGFRTFKNSEVWSVHYEQCNYFSQLSLENAFRQAGFQITESASCYQGDQYIYVEAVAGRQPQSVEPPSDEYMNLVQSFPMQFQERLGHWNDTLGKSQMGSTVLWGSGGKGITLLNSLHSPEKVAAVVDINPGRQASFIPGTGHEIIGPEQLPNLEPETVIITNAIYRKEIEAHLKSLQLNSKVAVA